MNAALRCHRSIRWLGRQRIIVCLAAGQKRLGSSILSLRLPHHHDFANHHHELLHIERLSDQCVDMPCLELYDLGIIECRRDEDDGSRLRRRPMKRLQELEAVQARHHEIKDDHRVLDIARHLEGSCTITRGVDLELFATQRGSEERADRVVILDYQHPWRLSTHFAQYASRRRIGGNAERRSCRQDGHRFCSHDTMLEPGTICRSRDAIIKCTDEEQGRLCHVVGVVPEPRWRTPGVPEYKVELIALPVTAFRRQGELTPLPPSETGTNARSQ
jgi:hypothetical protein